MEQDEVLYLEKRKIVPRWNPWLSGLVAMIFTGAIFYLTWWIFQDPRGIMRLYTPYVGYMYCRWWLVVLIWIAYTFNFWPFKHEWLKTAHPLLKGSLLTALSIVILLLLSKGFFTGILGNLGFTYFNPERMTKLGTGSITMFYAEEYASTAIMMVAVTASWLSPAWVSACENVPWRTLPQPWKGISVWVLTFSLAMFIYFITFHGHMSILYYPWQEFSGVTAPYWEEFADTVSGNIHIGWIMCCSVVVWLYELTWEKYPFCLIKNPALRRFAAFFGILLIAVSLALFFYFAQELTFGEVIRGTRRDAAPDWRWLHVGECAIFFLVPALFVKFYCGNWPTKYSLPVRVFIRTILVIALGLALYYVYYRTGHLFLGTQKGFSHPQQFPMIPTIWLINIWLCHSWFMDQWPAYKAIPLTEAEIAAEEEKVKADIAAVNVDGKWWTGLVVGLGCGALLYFAIVYLLPVIYKVVTIIPAN